MVIVKSIAGFLNHEGGDLLIGVADDGSIVGLKYDYLTLRKKDRDGFELQLMKLVKDKLGGDVCTMLHVVFLDLDGGDVCRVLIEPSERPVYVQHQGSARYFVRTGNSTREFDTKEALDHVAQRQSRL
jgi:predicted HTH transcriptional regulator